MVIVLSYSVLSLYINFIYKNLYIGLAMFVLTGDSDFEFLSVNTRRLFA